MFLSVGYEERRFFFQTLVHLDLPVSWVEVRGNVVLCVSDSFYRFVTSCYWEGEWLCDCICRSMGHAQSEYKFRPMDVSLVRLGWFFQTSWSALCGQSLQRWSAFSSYLGRFANPQHLMKIWCRLLIGVPVPLYWLQSIIPPLCLPCPLCQSFLP